MNRCLPVVCCAAVCLAQTQTKTQAQDMSALFAAMPDAVIPQLPSAERKDLLALYLSGKPARLPNAMDGTAELLQLTDDYLLLRTTERSALEMKRLPLINYTYILCVVTTVEGPAPDSRIAFYSTDWQPLKDADALFSPPSPSWFVRENADSSAACLDALASPDMDLMTYHLSPDSLTLKVRFSAPLALNEDAKAKALPFLKDAPKVYVWQMSAFR